MFNLFNNNIDALAHSVLISSPVIGDPRFEHTVTYICDHSHIGAMGLVVNKEHPADWYTLLKDINIATKGGGDHVVLDGGPVEPERGLVIHDERSKWESTFEVADGICITSTRDVIDAMASDQSPECAQLVLGYAAWEAGQLEKELATDAWILVNPVNREAIRTLLFEIPVKHRWSWILRQLDFDFYQLAGVRGTA